MVGGVEAPRVCYFVMGLLACVENRAAASYCSCRLSEASTQGISLGIEVWMDVGAVLLLLLLLCGRRTFLEVETE